MGLTNTWVREEVISLLRFENARQSLHHWKHDNFEVDMVWTRLRIANGIAPACWPGGGDLFHKFCSLVDPCWSLLWNPCSPSESNAGGDIGKVAWPRRVLHTPTAKRLKIMGSPWHGVFSTICINLYLNRLANSGSPSWRHVPLHSTKQDKAAQLRTILGVIVPVNDNNISQVVFA